MSKIIDSYGPLNKKHERQIYATIDAAMRDCPRLLVVRFDLRLPGEELQDCLTDYRPDHGVWSRFIRSLVAQIKANIRRRKKQGKRVYPCKVRYIGVREFDSSGTKPHYHVCLLLNYLMYRGLHFKRSEHTNQRYPIGLPRMITNAWVRALKLEDKKYHKLVYFPGNCACFIFCEEDLDGVVQRVLYLAKTRSKHNEDGWRNFYCSRR